MNGLVLTVLVKELREGLRDRRGILAAVAATLGGPLLVGVIVMMLAGDRADGRNVRVAVEGGERAPALIQRLSEERLVLLSAPADLEGEVRAGRIDVGLSIPDDYVSKYGQVRTAVVRVVSDPTRGRSRESAKTLRDALGRYARQVANLRLIVRGVSPEVVAPLRVEDVDVSTTRARAAVALSILPVFLLVSVFVMGTSLAVDTTAGERERRSLEPLLLTGAPPLAIGIGKWGATAVLNIGGLVLTLACATAILTRLPLEDLGVRLDSVGTLMAGVLAAGIPLAMLASALQVAAATQARTFKEGQTYLSMLLFVPMVTGMLLAFSHAEFAPWRLAIPVVAQHHLIEAALRGDVPGVLGFVVPGLVALVLTAGLLRWTATLLVSDRILYGR